MCCRSACDQLVFLSKRDTPLLYDQYCTGCVKAVCPNGKGLSNIEHAVCDDTKGGTWSCYNKQDAPFETLPVCAPGPPTSARR